MKKLSFFVTIIFLLTICSCIVKADADINVLLNGKAVAFNDDTGYPYIDENNRTMVPLRVTMESAGFVVGYDENIPTAIIITEFSRIEIPINTNKVYVNNILKENDTNAVIKDGHTYLPIRIILEAAHYTVEWDSNMNTVNAYTYDYNEEKFYPYSTSDLSTLVDNVLNGNVVYINGQYYATPEYVKLSNNVQVHYSGDDLNKAIYPESDRFDLVNSNFSFENTTSASEWISQRNLYLYNDTLRFEFIPQNGKSVPALIQSSTLTGTVFNKYILDELPLNFTEINEKYGTYNNLNIRIINGECYFKKSDLDKICVVQ